MEHNRTSTKSVPFFVALVSEPEFGQDLVWWGTCISVWRRILNKHARETKVLDQLVILHGILILLNPFIVTPIISKFGYIPRITAMVHSCDWLVHACCTLKLLILTPKGSQCPKWTFLILSRLQKLGSRLDSCEILHNRVLPRVLANKTIFIKNT